MGKGCHQMAVGNLSVVHMNVGLFLNYHLLYGKCCIVPAVRYKSFQNSKQRYKNRLDSGIKWFVTAVLSEYFVYWFRYLNFRGDVRFHTKYLVFNAAFMDWMYK